MDFSDLHCLRKLILGSMITTERDIQSMSGQMYNNIQCVKLSDVPMAGSDT